MKRRSRQKDDKYIMPQSFTSNQAPLYYKCLKGYKKMAWQLSRTKSLKTKHLKQKEMNSLRYDGKAIQAEEQQYLQIQNQQIIKQDLASQSYRSSFHRRGGQSKTKSNFHIGTIEKVKEQTLQKVQRSLSNQDEFMIKTTSLITKSQQNIRKSQKQKQRQRQKQRQKEQIPHFFSKNLHMKMNHYLNMVVAKSAQDQKLKMKKIEQEKTLNQFKQKQKQRLTYRNSFLRKLKEKSIRPLQTTRIPNFTPDGQNIYNAQHKKLINLTNSILIKSARNKFTPKITSNERQRRSARLLLNKEAGYNKSEQIKIA